MRNDPLISVLLPVYNAQDFVRDAIISIINQTYKKYELIIIDDHSSDQTSTILKSISDKRFKIIENTKQLGVSHSLNRGLKASKGEFIARMDADDIAYPTRFKTQIDALRQHPTIGIIGSAVDLINKKSQIVGSRYPPDSWEKIKKRLNYSNPMIHPTVVFKRILWLKYGGYDAKMDGAEDYDLWLRFARFTKMLNLPYKLLKYRISKESVSYKNNRKINQAYINVKLKAIKHYKYPVWNLVSIMKPLVSSLLPTSIWNKIYTYYYNYD